MSLRLTNYITKKQEILQHVCDFFFAPEHMYPHYGEKEKKPGPSCSKLMMSLVNDSLKFTSSPTQLCWNFLLKKCESAKATHIFSAKNIRILCIESAKTVNEMTLNELVKLTTLWTTGPRSLSGLIFFHNSTLKLSLTKFKFGLHLGFSIGTVLGILICKSPLPTKFRVSWPFCSGEEVQMCFFFFLFLALTRLCSSEQNRLTILATLATFLWSLIDVGPSV